jgi:hypothetical protein
MEPVSQRSSMSLIVTIRERPHTGKEDARCRTASLASRHLRRTAGAVRTHLPSTAGAGSGRCAARAGEPHGHAPRVLLGAARWAQIPCSSRQVDGRLWLLRPPLYGIPAARPSDPSVTPARSACRRWTVCPGLPPRSAPEGCVLPSPHSTPSRPSTPWHRPPHRPGPVPALWAGVSCREAVSPTPNPRRRNSRGYPRTHDR